MPNAVGSSVFNILVGLGLPYATVLAVQHTTAQVFISHATFI